ncbi:MAG: periplasmic heavy metal sensor [Acidobacteriota bacterium]|nr:periplasmic heavy metal sensor [Acidobacteriota bacterium]
MSPITKSRARVWVFAAAFAGLALPAVSQQGFPDGKWWKRPRLMAEINLSSEQSREIEKIFVHSRTRLIDLKADLEKKQLALQSSMEDRAADRRTVEKEIEQVENARAELQKARAVMVLDIKQVLKPDQWERLLQMQQDRKERRMMAKEGRQNGYRQGPGGQNRLRTPRGE